MILIPWVAAKVSKVRIANAFADYSPVQSNHQLARQRGRPGGLSGAQTYAYSNSHMRDSKDVATWVSWIPDILNTSRRRRVRLSGHVVYLTYFGKQADVLFGLPGGNLRRQALVTSDKVS
jgi:hypothetical protein